MPEPNGKNIKKIKWKFILIFILQDNPHPIF